MAKATQRSSALTDTHLVLLSAAARHPKGALTRPERMPEGTFARAAQRLLRRGLIEQVAGQTRSGAADEGTDRVRRFRITHEGLTAIGIEPEPTLREASRRADPKQRGRRRAKQGSPETSAQPEIPRAQVAVSGTKPTQHRPGTKRAHVIALLSREQGAQLSELMATTGWLAHTTRAALTGLRQKGYAIERCKTADGTSAYRIIADAAETRMGEAA